jgi:hypothetical protein
MNNRPDYPNLDALKARLTLTNERLRTIATGLNLNAPPQALQQQVIDAHLPPNLHRLVLFLFANNGSRTDAISSALAIGNVSDTYTKPRTREQLKQLSLIITCEVMPAVNRYGSFTSMGHLFIKPSSDNKLWHPKKSAND